MLFSSSNIINGTSKTHSSTLDIHTRIIIITLWHPMERHIHQINTMCPRVISLDPQLQMDSLLQFLELMINLPVFLLNHSLRPLLHHNLLKAPAPQRNPLHPLPSLPHQIPSIHPPLLKMPSIHQALCRTNHPTPIKCRFTIILRQGLVMDRAFRHKIIIRLLVVRSSSRGSMAQEWEEVTLTKQKTKSKDSNCGTA